MSRTRVVSYVDNEVLKTLRELYGNSDKPLSHIISELIDIGYRVKQHHDSHSNQQEDKKVELIGKHTEYLLKIISVVIDTYRCVRNEKSKYKETTVDEVLTKISANAQNFITKKLDGNS